jgi:hypothetical protein
MNEAEEALLPGWSHQIRMLFSARLWKSFVYVFGIPVLLLSIVMTFASKPGDGMVVLLGGLGLFGLLWALVGAVVDLTGGFTAAFLVTDRGVHFRLGKGARGAAEAATLIGILARSPSGAGAGMLALSEQDGFIAWSDIRKVTISDRSRYVQIRAGFGSKPIGIYCTEQNFSAVCDLIQARRAQVKS